MAFELPQLPYAYNALEPVIDEQTMHLHHEKHHAGYVEKLNAALQNYEDLQNLSIEDLLAQVDDLPDDIRTAVQNNGGGHANHSLFWEIMRAPQENNVPSGKISEAINTTFGSFDEFKKQFTEKAMSVFGSGWTFLMVTKEGQLQLKRHSFQNSPLMQGNNPILGLDVWEHAYYLKYQNRRVEYVEAWWAVVNWAKVEDLFTLAPQS